MVNNILTAGEIIGKAQELIVSNMSVLAQLTNTEKEVVLARMGLAFDGASKLNLEKASEKLGLTRERVRQIEMKAYRKLLGIK